MSERDEQSPQTIREALTDAARTLRASNLPEARRDALMLLESASGRDRTRILVHYDEHLTPEELGRFRDFVRRRVSGEPVQYITARQEFFGLEFEVTPAVLIPRPETESIVEIGLNLLKGDLHRDSQTFCDVGTGSGCITVALLHNLPHARAVALDISLPALLVARRNALHHHVAARVAFVASDLFAALKGNSKRFDLIVSNPPYIAEDELAEMQREVRDYEPRRALTPGGDGLAVVRRLLAEAPTHLASRGHLVFEIGYRQETAVRELIDARVWELVEVRADLQGIPRVFVVRLKS